MEKEKRPCSTLKKRILSLLLTMCLIAGLMPAVMIEKMAIAGDYPQQGSELTTIQATYAQNTAPIIMHYNFWKLSKRSATGFTTDYNTAFPLKDVTSFDMTTEGATGEIYPKSQYPNTTVVTDPWCYSGIGGGAANFWFADIAYGLMLDKNAGAWGQLKVRVPNDGIYSAVSVNGKWTNGGIVRFYLAPDGAENPMAPEYSLGLVDTYNPTNSWITENKLGSRQFTKGDYILTYQITGKNPGNKGDARFAVGGFKLYPLEALPTMDITEAAITNLKMYDTAESVLNYTLSDGSNQDIYAATIIAVPRDASIAEAAVVTSSDGKQRSIRVKGLNAASTFIDVTVKMAGNPDKTLEIPVTVIECGELNSVSLSISDSASGRIANKTKHALNIKLIDKDFFDIPLGNASITYKVEPESIASATAEGILYVLANGTATVTATAYVQNITKSATININVCESGENLMSDRNGDFEGEITTSNWDWSVNYAAPSSTSDLAQWSSVDIQGTDNNISNKALGIHINPNKAQTGGYLMTLKTNELGRVKLKPGKLYELSLWLKITDLTKPDDTPFNLSLDLYDFAGASGSAAAFPTKMYRNYDYKGEIGYPQAYASWKKITLPVSAPTDCSGELWVTPRIIIRGVATTGFGGTYWFDNFELREVGFDRIEATNSGNVSVYGDKSVITLKPYSTTNNFISIFDSKIPEVAFANSSDDDIISVSNASSTGYTGPESKLSKDLKIPSITTTVEGKNGTTTVTSSITLGGETRSVDTQYSLSGLPNTFKSILFSMEKTELKSGETMNTALSGKMMDGSNINFDSCKIFYDSSDPRIAAIDQNGIITAKNEGTADVTVYVQFGEAIKTVKKTIKIVDPSVLKTVTLSPSDVTVECFLTKPLTVSAVKESGYAANLAAAQVSYTVVESVPEGAIEISADGVIKGKLAGTVKVRAAVSLEGITVDSNIINVIVTENTEKVDIVFDFSVFKTGNARNAAIDSHNWAINLADSSSYVAGLLSGFRYQVYGIQSQINKINTARESDTAFDVLIPRSGDYLFEFQGGNYVAGGIASIYIDGKYMGEYDFSNGNKNIDTGTVVQMNSLNLNAGVHRGLVRSTGSSDTNETTRGYQQYLRTMKFIALDSLPTISDIALKSTKSIMVIGEHAALASEVLMSNGVPFSFGKLLSGADDPDNYYKITNSDPSIVTVDENGTITALKAGASEITLTATVRGISMSKSITIQVEEQAIAKVEAVMSNSQLYPGETVQVIPTSSLSNGRVLDNGDVTYTYTSSDINVFTVDNGKIVGVGAGIAQLTVTATFNGISVVATVPVKVLPEGLTVVKVTADTQVIKPESGGTQLTVTCTTNLGNVLDMKDAIIKYQSDNTGVVTVDNTGFVKPIGIGSALITVEVTLGEITRKGEIYISVSSSKTASSFFTAEKVAAAQENIKNYKWAADIKKAAVAAAEKYVGNDELLWNMVTTQELPRGITVGYINDPDAFTCRYCHANIQAIGGNYPWICNPLTDPWKIQCPACMRKFPSNDFGSFYKLGIDENGNWDYEQAKQKNAELVAKGEDGYLKNILYPEMGEGWGVDDGYGYKPGKTYSNGVEECHTYIAYYNHFGLWSRSGANNPGVIIDALETLQNAYLYTGKAEYGRTGAILIDRIADLYPDYNLDPYKNFYNSHGMYFKGKIIGRIWETGLARFIAYAYDAFYPAMDDPYVVEFLSGKAAEYKLKNTKKTPSQIRQNCEDGILRETYKAVLEGNIIGNFGMHQSLIALDAVILDSMPETKLWLDWVYNQGGLNLALINSINRDGHGLEGSPVYNQNWLTDMMAIADILAGYEGYTAADLYKNPKFKKMLTAMFPLTLCRRATAQIGDSSNTAYVSLVVHPNTLIKAFYNTGESSIAQMLYHVNGDTAAGLHTDIFTKNPEQIAEQIQKIIDEQGEYDFDNSEMLPGYGFAILRDGSLYKSASDNGVVDNQRDFYMYFGRNSGHAHADALNLSIHAYGLDMAPDMGYPETAGVEPNRLQWQTNTISHNTVVVNNTKQDQLARTFTPTHFDDAGMVKIMDVDAKQVYASTNVYRRSVVMVKVNDDISYGVDFFRINGGNDHLYSFHSMSDEITEMQGFKPILQPMGTYAGPTVEWGANDNFKDSGYSWLSNVRKAMYPETGEIAVDFKVKDFRGTLPSPMDLHLRMTMLNDFDLSEVSIVEGLTPRVAKNAMIPKFEYVLARRTGINLDSLFTTVFEPYSNERYLANMESVPVSCISGTEARSDVAKAIKVTHKNGRVDYIIYATNNQAEYRVDNLFNFRGFVGVYSLVNGKQAFSYVNDGDKIGDIISGTAAVTGTVKDFTREFSKTNHITVTANEAVDPNMLTGKYIYVKNDGVENGAYRIIGAKRNDDGTLILDIGDVTTIRKYKNTADFSEGYVYNISEGQSYRIPLTSSIDNSPVFDKIGTKTVDAKSNIHFTVSAKSPVGNKLTYSAVTLPSGASFNPETQEFTWIPDKNQVGVNHVAISVSDGILSSTEHFFIKVLSGKNDNDENPPETTNPLATTNPPETTNPLATTNPPITTNPPDGKFKDLTGYDWAKVEINLLAAKGIIKGTGEDTYSPEANIKRADFAILLVRALELKSDNNDNFSDVPSDAYYAGELAIAKDSGIIMGVGKNLFNPTAQITRQEAMVIIARALDKAGIKLESGSDDTLKSFSDADKVEDYAKAAVSMLIKNNIVKGDNGRLNPNGNATRAEIAVLLYRILAIINK